VPGKGSPGSLFHPPARAKHMHASAGGYGPTIKSSRSIHRIRNRFFISRCKECTYASRQAQPSGIITVSAESPTSH
jgi:hypothetical protein